MTYNNYSISSGKGKLYLKAKQPTEGFEEVIYGTEGKKTYHKYFNSMKGVPKYFETKEVQHNGKTLRFLELTLVDGEDYNKLSTALKNKNGYTDEVKQLVSALYNLDLGEEVILSVNKGKYINKLGLEKETFNVYVNYTGRLGENGKGLGTGFIPFAEIPKAEKEVDEEDGEVTWNWKPVNKFFTAKIKDIEAKFQGGVITSTPTPTAQSKEVATDLPF